MESEVLQLLEQLISRNKIDNNLYKGALIKSGQGTLVMTGNNSYTGGTEVKEGSLFGFTESFGSADVNVNGGTFGIGYFQRQLYPEGTAQLSRWSCKSSCTESECRSQ